MDMAPGSQFRFDGLTYLNPPSALETMGYLTITAVRGAYHYMIQRDRIEQFEIRPNGAYTGIKGTEFVMEFTDTYTKVKVLDGTVEFGKQGSAASVLVNAGETSTLETSESAPTQPQEFNTAGESRWWSSLGGGGSSCCGTAFILMIVPLLAIVFRSD
jgi:ferric-dicitrate binding protein FerR (iron transport regulator)